MGHYWYLTKRDDITINEFYSFPENINMTILSKNRLNISITKYLVDFDLYI